MQFFFLVVKPMRSMLSFLLAPLALCALIGAPAHAATPAEAADKLRAFLDGVPGLGPGYAVVVVDRERHVLDYVRGQRNAVTGAPLTMDTPIYIASQTKAYMGLLAQRLDQRGVLRLDSTLAEHWPQLKLPGGVDPAAWTLADLLNHRVPLSGDALTWLEAYIGSPDPLLYPDLLATLVTPRAAGFDYDNLGYNIYAAILYQQTGKRWQDWLQQELFAPLGLRNTSARTSSFDPAQLAYSHQWLGEPEGWEVVPPKPDTIMQSAGGMMTSPNDMARWLQLHLGGAAPATFDKTLLAAAHRSGVQVDPKARNAYELPCNGYAFGWNVCDFEGRTLYIHGGGYTGARTMMAFSPDLGVGIGVFSNSDNATGWLTSRTVIQYLQYLVDHPEAAKWATTRQEMYPQRVAQQLEGARKRQQETRADPQWSGWAWQPDAKTLAQYAGRYRSERMPVTAEVTAAPNGLRLQLGALQRQLEPASPDLFGANALRLDPPEPLRFLRDEHGHLTGFEFDGERYLAAP